ncbi:hypothetical protein R7V75_01590 [Mesomycoplasma ovipneumoniae]|nr:hypothetical protein [Mesomycoplasma ovipneumoniae]MDW2908419.1 hypothetical protein [Mesomycoplasma ovipneumoniae]
MPIRDMSSDKTDIDQLVKKFEISTKEINLSSTFENLKDLFSLKNQLGKIIKKIQLLFKLNANRKLFFTYIEPKKTYEVLKEQ